MVGHRSSLADRVKDDPEKGRIDTHGEPCEREPRSMRQALFRVPGLDQLPENLSVQI
jgi:hypothetical protein